MDEITDSIVGILKKYITELEKSGIHIKSAFLFGSYAHGRIHEWSDIDIALVSDDFEGVRFYDREKIAEVTLNIDSRISPLPYKTEDFIKDDLFVRDILDKGVRIV
ncbi:MAG: nucleotidyltransferase domain-containing protein [bacterium]